MTPVAVNPYFAARDSKSRAAIRTASARRIEKVTIGDATLYRANCFDVLPNLGEVAAVAALRNLFTAALRCGKLDMEIYEYAL